MKNKYKRLTTSNVPCSVDSLRFNPEHKQYYYKLQELEDKIEQGTIVELPVRLGQEVWYIPHYHGKSYCGVKKDVIRMIGFSSRGFQFRLRDAADRQKTYMLGKSVFLTKEEAEGQLKKEETIGSLNEE